MRRGGRSAFDDLAARLRGMARDEATAVAPPVERFQVTASRPLVIEDFGGEVRLEEGDPDVEWARDLLDDETRPEEGDMVRVHRDADGDWIVSGVIASGDDE